MPEASNIKLSMAEPDIAVLTFDAADKGANVLSAQFWKNWNGTSTSWKRRRT